MKTQNLTPIARLLVNQQSKPHDPMFTHGPGKGWLTLPNGRQVTPPPGVFYFGVDPALPNSEATAIAMKNGKRLVFLKSRQLGYASAVRWFLDEFRRLSHAK